MERQGDLVVSLIVWLAVAVIGGCSDEYAEYRPITSEEANRVVESQLGDEHSGHHHGPHGGEVIELGDHELHAEVQYFADVHMIIVHILGEDALSALSIAATGLTLTFEQRNEVEEFKLEPVPTEGEPAGQASKFSLTSEEFMRELGRRRDGVTLTISYDGKEYRGTVPQDPHAPSAAANEAPAVHADDSKTDAGGP